MISAGQYDPTITKSQMGIKAGVILATKLAIDGTAPNEIFDTDPEPSFGFFLDLPVHNRLLAGISFDLHYIAIEGFKKRHSLFDISFNLKRRYRLKDKVTEIRAGAAFGMGRLSGLRSGQRPTSHFIIKGILEVAFWQSRKTAWLAEATLIASPWGGNRSVDASISPTLLLRGGILF